jgi:hypothetical protein
VVDAQTVFGLSSVALCPDLLTNTSSPTPPPHLLHLHSVVNHSGQLLLKISSAPPISELVSQIGTDDPLSSLNAYRLLQSVILQSPVPNSPLRLLHSNSIVKYSSLLIHSNTPPSVSLQAKLELTTYSTLSINTDHHT